MCYIASSEAGHPREKKGRAPVSRVAEGVGIYVFISN